MCMIIFWKVIIWRLITSHKVQENAANFSIFINTKYGMLMLWIVANNNHNCPIWILLSGVVLYYLAEFYNYGDVEIFSKDFNLTITGYLTICVKLNIHLLVNLINNILPKLLPTVACATLME